MRERSIWTTSHTTSRTGQICRLSTEPRSPVSSQSAVRVGDRCGCPLHRPMVQEMWTSHTYRPSTPSSATLDWNFTGKSRPYRSTRWSRSSAHLQIRNEKSAVFTNPVHVDVQTASRIDGLGFQSKHPKNRDIGEGRSNHRTIH